MSSEILIIREGSGFRLLHGQLRLVNILSHLTEVTVNVTGEGQAKIVKAAQGFLVEKNDQRLPLRRS